VSRLDWLNGLSFEEARAELLRCCGSTRWAEGLARARPLTNEAALYAEADRLWAQTGPEDWREAMTHHPRIGDVSKLREKFKTTATWSSQEQRGVQGASEEVLHALAEGNRAYEARFGFIFLVCATGKSAGEMLALLRERMNNPPDVELRVAAGEQAKITRIRLEKLLTSP
jgi:2-oxo-4-hydroxy-4-carboxy-5-ureidoimidazoline decarboxylase